MSNTPFQSHVALLHNFISRRGEIVDRIDQLLNCQKKPLEYQQDATLLSQSFLGCFFLGLPPAQIQLKDQLEYAHWDSGFKPRANPGNDIIDPVALMTRAFHCWNLTRWPGQKGRVRYAHTLFNAYLVRCLALLGMRLWDDGMTDVGQRLSQAQEVLDALWRSSPADQPVLVRNLCWLLPVAMSPTTDDLRGYFDIAAKVAATFPPAALLAAQKAAVQTGGGHLRSQLFHLARRRGVSLNEHDLLMMTRISNALDISLLMEGLATLMQAYEKAVQSGTQAERLALAAAISEGLSPDPELFINRLDLLGPYTMIEHLFITVDAAGQASCTAAGQRHLQLLQDYTALISRLAKPLYEDCQQQRPQPGHYSPYGALYGFSSNLLELAAFKSLQLDADTRFCMEDVFTAGGADKLAWVNSWRRLPHIKPEVVQQFEYPQQFVDEVHARVERELQRHVAAVPQLKPTGKLYLTAGAALPAELSHIADMPPGYVVASDAALVAAGRAEAKDQDDLLYCRLEGEFIVSYATSNGWVGVTKDVLSEIVGEGRDAALTGLPAAAIAVLALMCPQLVVVLDA